MGLCMAAELYDPTHGTTFSTYASAVMEGVIKHVYYYNKRIVRYGGPKTTMRAWMLRAVDISKPLDPSVAQEASLFSRALTETEVSRYYGFALGSDNSLDVLVTLEDGQDVVTMVETLPDDGSLTPIEERIDGGFVQRLLAAMSPSSRQASRVSTIIQDRILADEPRALEDIAAEWGCTRQRVHQIESEILRSLRRAAEGLGITE